MAPPRNILLVLFLTWTAVFYIIIPIFILGNIDTVQALEAITEPEHEHEQGQDKNEKRHLLKLMGNELTMDQLERYPFTGLADIMSPSVRTYNQTKYRQYIHDDDDEHDDEYDDDNNHQHQHQHQHQDPSVTSVGLYWQIPRSGGTTLKYVLGVCLELTQASRTSKDYCDVERPDLHVCSTRFGKYVNADTSDDYGIVRAHRLNLVPSQMVDVIVSSRFLHVSGLFDPYHRGKAFTILRDPIERAVSTFYYLRNAKWERNYNAEFQNMTLLQYATREDTSSNWMTRWLTGKHSAPYVEPSDLHFAKEVLRRKFLVLLTSDMLQSVNTLISYMNWEPDKSQYQCIQHNVDMVVKHNKSMHPKLINIDPKVRQALIQKNLLDIELYDYAKEFLYPLASTYKYNHQYSNNG